MPTRLEDVPDELVVDFDIHDHSLADVVHERLAEIQATTPVAFCPAHGGYWLLTRYRDVHDMLRDWETFSSTENSVPPIAADKFLPLQYDPPEHTAYRQLLNPLFTAARMKALEVPIRATATRLLDQFASDGECEFVSAFADPLPTNTFLDLMGWPTEDAPRFGQWNESILFGKPDGSAEEDAAVRLGASTEVFEYFAKFVQERRNNPDVDDVTGILLKSRYNNERLLTEDEVLRALWLLMIGGLHTVRSVLAFGIVHFAENPDERQKILDDPSLIRSAVEEMLRIDPPAMPGRIVTHDVVVGGVQLREGDRVIGFSSSANRDEEEFPCPHAMQVDRNPNRHLTFGGGVHRCVGSNLARVELIIAVEEIHRRIPDYRLIPDRPVRRHLSQVRGVHEVPIAFTPEAR